jgi:hypothetical protein
MNSVMELFVFQGIVSIEEMSSIPRNDEGWSQVHLELSFFFLASPLLASPLGLSCFSPSYSLTHCEVSHVSSMGPEYLLTKF